MFPGQEPLTDGPCCCLWIDCVACSPKGDCATFNYHVYDRVLTEVKQADTPGNNDEPMECDSYGMDSTGSLRKKHMPLNKIFLKTTDFTLPKNTMKKLKKTYRSRLTDEIFVVDQTKSALAEVGILCSQDVLQRAIELVVDNGAQEIAFHELVILFIILSQDNVEVDDAFKKLEKDDSQWIIRNSRCTSRTRSIPPELDGAEV
jgi:hypothetical protein